MGFSLFKCDIAVFFFWGACHSLHFLTSPYRVIKEFRVDLCLFKVNCIEPATHVTYAILMSYLGYNYTQIGFINSHLTLMIIVMLKLNHPIIILLDSFNELY